MTFFSEKHQELCCLQKTLEIEPQSHIIAFLCPETLLWFNSGVKTVSSEKYLHSDGVKHAVKPCNLRSGFCHCERNLLLVTTGENRTEIWISHCKLSKFGERVVCKQWQ